ncbi:MAG: guanidinoacetate N-methyltransferase [Parcubacteria bacterium C7867-007]|nr:MAG: guanidinoacetate N-methyltransferase [Parcubacteria bacterium C7867-007]
MPNLAISNKEDLSSKRDTVESRITIGFKERETWKDSSAIFDDHTLQIQGHPVMEDWEDNYMQQLAKVACSQGGIILEVGYGMGISASYIQKEHIDKHIIIEANRDVYERLLDFSRNSKVTTDTIFGFWEECITNIPDNSINGILFDTYPLSEKEIHKNHFSFFSDAYRLLVSGGVLTYYSDEIQDFSDEHTEKLRAAGFKQIDKSICDVEPPLNCKYWNSNTLMVPVIRK